MHKFLSIATTILILSGLVRGQEKFTNEAENAEEIKEKVVQLCTDWDNAYIRKDLDALKRILADDFVGIDDQGNVTGKADEISLTQSGDFVLTSVVRLEPLKVRFYGATAVVTGFSRNNQKYKGVETTGRGRFTIVCVQKNGRWQIASWQGTSVKGK